MHVSLCTSFCIMHYICCLHLFVGHLSGKGNCTHLTLGKFCIEFMEKRTCASTLFTYFSEFVTLYSSCTPVVISKLYKYQWAWSYSTREGCSMFVCNSSRIHSVVVLFLRFTLTENDITRLRIHWNDWEYFDMTESTSTWLRIHWNDWEYIEMTENTLPWLRILFAWLEILSRTIPIIL